VIGDDIVPMERATHENRTGEKDMTHGNDPSEIGLTREKEFSRCLLESMADGVVACDADGILTLFNRTAREWHGIDLLRLPPDEWARHYNLFRPDGISPLPNDEIPLSRAFRGETVTDAGMAIKANGKPIRFILANGSVILDERGQKLGAVVIMRDVTEFRRLELELRKSNQELEKRVEERTKELQRINGQLQIELSERHRIENSLMMTQFSVDNAADGIMWLRSDGSYCYANEAASRLLGYSARELLTMKASDVNPAHLREEWPQHWEELKRSKTLFFEATLIRKGGSPVPVEIHANYVEFDGQEYNCASVRDITGRKRMEDALLFVAQRGWLAGTENFFDALAQYLGEKLDVDYVIIVRLDEIPGFAETVSLYARGAIVPNMRYALKGTPCENVMGRRLCVYPHDVQQLFPEDTLLAEMGVESYIGIPLWDSSGRPTGLIALMDSKPLSDTASAIQILQLVATRAAAELERERSDRILRTREHEFRTLAESLPDNIVRYDREGRTVYINPVLEKTLGSIAAQKIGMRVREFHTDGSYESYAQTLDAVLASGEDGELELIFPGTVEEPRVHHIRMIAERGEGGHVTGVLAIGRDITERKRVETELLVRQQRLSEVTTELSMAEERERRRIATELHDNIGQDLVLARINLGMLAKSPMTSKQSLLLGKTRDILGEMIQRVRSLTHRISPPILENGGLEAALKCLGKQLETDIGLAVVFKHDSNERPLTEDIRSVLYFAARELLINVAKHAQTRRAAVTIRCENSCVIIKIEDDGVGFDPESIESTLNKDGSGFGLFNLQRRIKHLGGLFELESSAGLGTRATIVMPLSEGTS